MRIWMLATGAAALAITAPALADPKGGQGGGKGGKGQSAQVERGGGGQKAERARGGGKDRVVQAERGGDRGNRAFRAQGGDDNRRAMKAARVEDRGKRELRAERVDDNRGRGRGDDARIVRADNDLRGRGNSRFAEGERVFKARDVKNGVVRVRDVDRDDLFVQRLGYGAGGCPPGLLKKPVACMPPGQAAKFVGQPLIAASRIAALGPLPLPLRSLYLDDDDSYYRYGGGYLYRVDREDDLIASMIPLFGAALLGQPLQSAFVNNAFRPAYFNSFYPNSPYDCYQYGYGYVYETDCASGLVEDVIPTYDYGYGVGQMLPASYGYYNVPYAYRGYFPDNDDSYYRYAPGAIYQVDRDTALISSVAALLTGGLTVGQPLPVGYSAYNVPYAYRTTYMDTPDMWYRYNNGYIYGVDPTTMLVTSIVDAIV